jgi:hypothetical protein
MTVLFHGENLFSGNWYVRSNINGWWEVISSIDPEGGWGGWSSLGAYKWIRTFEFNGSHWSAID